MEAPGVAIGQEVEEEEEQAIQGSCALHFVRSSRRIFPFPFSEVDCIFHAPTSLYL